MRFCSLIAAWLALTAAATAAAAPPMYALIVAGGPDEDDNAAQIEGHARFVGQLVPTGARRIVLFADGKTDGAKVCYVDPSADATVRHAMSVLLPKDDDVGKPDLRPLRLGLPLDGGLRHADLHRAIGKLAAEAASHPAPMLLYFAGHGSSGDDHAAPAYDMWGEELLDAHQLATEIARLPRTSPVVLVMAQCFSGAFGDVLFTGGEAKGAVVSRDIAGFFSAAPTREASGCSWETGEADYQDFSSYFFGALSGRDRFGHAVTGADFDGDGKVTLHEAFCYALIHDASIDTPLCTSEVFLKRFVHLEDGKLFGVPYPTVATEATPAQRAALETLSQRLGLTGDARALTACDRLNYADPIARNFQLDAENAATKQLNDLRQTTLESFFKDWPDLRWNHAKGYDAAVAGATKQLGKDQALCKNLLDTQHASDAADGTTDNEEADLMRFTALYAAVVRAQDLRDHGTKTEQSQFQRIWQAEQQTLPLATASSIPPTTPAATNAAPVTQ